MKFLIKIKPTKSDPKRKGGEKCPPSCQLGLRDFPLYGRTTEQKADVPCLIYLPKSNAAANGTSPNNLNNS